MFCHSCGEENLSTAQFCGACGVGFLSAGVTAVLELPRVSFIEAVQTCLRKYFDFNGRATRAEFWWFFLFESIISGIAWGIDTATGSMGYLELLVFLAFLFPGVAVGARRLHDINKSGWWQLSGILLIPYILLIVWWIRRGNEGSNEYGPDPRTTPPRV